MTLNTDHFIDSSPFSGVREFDTPDGRMYAECYSNDGWWKVYFRRGNYLAFEYSVKAESGKPEEIYRKWRAKQ